MLPRSIRKSFMAMGTTCEVIGVGVSPSHYQTSFERIVKEASDWEATFSRFLPDSELSRLNQMNGEALPVSSRFLKVLDLASTGYIATEGRFDPFVIDALEAAGYDRSFELLRSENPAAFEHIQECEGRGGNDRPPVIQFSYTDGTVQLPAGARLDLGGIVKGAFVDAMRAVIEDWAGGIIDAGGDMAISGHPEGDDYWHIGVQFPGRPDEDIAAVTLPGGGAYGIATSSTQQRRWKRGRDWQTHLIDPASGRSVPLSTPNVTIVADSAARAEIESKSLLVALSRGEAIPAIRQYVAIVADEQGHYEVFEPTSATATSMEARDASQPAA